MQPTAARALIFEVVCVNASTMKCAGQHHDFPRQQFPAKPKFIIVKLFWHQNRYFPEDPILKMRITKFVRAWTEGVSDIVKFTPKGLAYSGPWGSLRHVGNAMFLLKAWAVGSPNADPAIKQSIDCTVRKQLGYILGDTGRSFVVGYGTNPPARPHHRSSSCPPLGVQCTWDFYNNPGPNPHTLYGALVGGPGANDDYTDDRNDYIKNEVATDYNAGFTGTVSR